MVTNEASKLKMKEEVALHTEDEQAAGLLAAECCPQQRFTGVQVVQAIKGHELKASLDPNQLMGSVATSMCV